MNFRLSRKIRRYLAIYVSIARTMLTTPQDYRRILNYGEGLYNNVPLTDLWLDLPSRTICPFISSHFFGKKDAENLALRDQELCVAAHLFAEEINTESDLVGENYRLYIDKMFDEKQQAIISYFSITDVGSTEYHLKTPTYLFVVITPFFPILSINC